MEFQTIQQVREELGIGAEDREEIRREVRRKLLQVHPDALSGAGLPEDHAKGEQVLLLTAALNFLDKPEGSGDLVPRETQTELVKLMRDLVQREDSQSAQREVARREQDAEQALAHTSAAKVREIKSAGQVRLITLGSLAVLLTALWLFPTSVRNNAILSDLILHPTTGDPTGPFALNATFTVIWLCALVVTATAWFLFKWRTEEETLFQRTLNLESTQNLLFDSFRSAPRNLAEVMREISLPAYLKEPIPHDLLRSVNSNWFYQQMSRENSFYFSGRPLVGEVPGDPKLVERWLNEAQDAFRDAYQQWVENKNFHKVDFVSHIETQSLEYKRQIANSKARMRLLTLVFRSFSREPIEAELAQKVADLILARGEVNGAVRKVDSPSLDERYSLTPADDTEIEKP